MTMPTLWVCVAHRWAVPTVLCGARGDEYTAGDKYCKETGHPIVTTTVRHLADQLAYRDEDACLSCGRRWDHDLEPSSDPQRCPDCAADARREAP